MTDWKPRAEKLARELLAAGALHPAWQAAFMATPRHLFIPRFYRGDQYNQPRYPVDRTDEPAWLDSIYRDQVLVTHYRTEGTMPDGQPVHIATSSASMPSLVAAMLDRLQVQDGHRVLEIGTGTGYHAALLSARLGSEQVTSIEVDGTTLAEAAEHLALAGRHPHLVHGDGAAGHADRAPYDRIIATCAVDRIPTAWIAQLAPGGRIVTPLTVGYALAVLDRDHDHAGEVTGRIDSLRVGFMPLRAAEPPRESHPVPHPAGVSHSGLTVVDPRWLDPLAGDRTGFGLWLALHLPTAGTAVSCAEDGTPTGLVVRTADSRADAGFEPAEDGRWPVTQSGAHRLWDTVEAAWHAWQRHGEPDRTRIRITARVDGEQWAWLDQPRGPLRWPLPGDPG